MTRSIAERLRSWLLLSGSLSFFLLLLFVYFDFDRIFDQRYREMGVSGIAAEIGDHVILPLLVLLPPLLLTLPLAVTRALAPLGMAARRIDEASGKERGFRAPLEGVPAEAAPFVTSFNGLLKRLDESADRQEAFASDIAHELKTPLAILQLELEAYGDPLADRIRDDLKSMNRLIDQLLLIAQLDADAVARLPFDSVDLGDLARDVIQRQTAGSGREDQRIELQVLGSPRVEGRREAIGAALRNLIENALRVTPAGEAVTVIVGPLAELRVRDGGTGLTAARLAEVSQRLTRADHASCTGAGLGLSIVHKVMVSHGGGLTTSPEDRELKLSFRSPV
ncbi:MAG: HAMP domain-containing histidine kinase [Brevundimonas sp.]|nr:MAG: HAMP domain-containing histidine kinase [Brevundimonas sp.]